VLATPPLGANLNDALVPSGGLDHSPAFDDVVRDRLLHVNVLTCLASPHGGQGVPVIRSGNSHRGDGFVLQNTADVLLHAWGLLLPAGYRLERPRHHVFIHFAQVANVNIVESGKTSDQIPSATANPHDGQVDALIRLVRRTCGSQGCQGNSRCCQKTAAMNAGHDLSPLELAPPREISWRPEKR
jgi:hypothetical protein